MSGLKFADLANVQTVGIGLYLALAVIQGISATGIASLRRRVSSLRAAVVGARMRNEITNVRRLEADLSRLEIGFHSFNRTLLWVTALLFGVALAYFVYSTIEQRAGLPSTGLIFIVFFYVVLPVAIFLWSSAIVWKRCRGVVASIDAAEKRYSAAKLSA